MQTKEKTYKNTNFETMYPFKQKYFVAEQYKKNH